MPEGPEIRRAADRVARVLVNRRIVAAELMPPPLTRFGKRLTGTTVTAVDTRGKAMLTRFDNGLTLYSHNQLYGRWYTTRRPKRPATARQLRVALHTDTHSALLYSASDIEVLDDAGLENHPFLTRIGPDILDPALAAEDIVSRLTSDRFRNRSLAALYLDQAFLAGLGNYLRSEILWAAKLDPSTRPAALEPFELRRLARNTLRIPRRSYRTKGLTVPVTLARRLKDEGVRWGERRFQVFGREHRDCRRCKQPVRRITAGSRNLFLCDGCQRSRQPSAVTLSR